MQETTTPPPQFAKVPPSHIRVGRRSRIGATDLADLKYSIQMIGQRDPVIVTRESALVSGSRRLEVLQELERRVEVVVVKDFAQAREWLEAEGDTAAVPLKPSEKIALGLMLDALYRQRPLKGERRKHIASALGWSGFTYSRALSVVEAAERGLERGQEALEFMDAPGGSPGGAIRILQGEQVIAGKRQPRKPFALDSKRNVQLANKAKQRLWAIVHGLTGYADFTEDFDVDKALVAMSEEEVREMAKMIADSTTTLRRLRREIIAKKGTP